MSIVGDFITQITRTVLNEGLRKIGGKRRKRRLTPQQRIAREIEKLVKPAKRQTSRKRTAKARSKVWRR